MAMEKHLSRGGSEADFESPNWWIETDSDSDTDDEWGYVDDGFLSIVSFPSHVVWMCLY